MIFLPGAGHCDDGYKGREWDARQKRYVEWLAETFKSEGRGKIRMAKVRRAFAARAIAG